MRVSNIAECQRETGFISRVIKFCLNLAGAHVHVGILETF